MPSSIRGITMAYAFACPRADGRPNWPGNEFLLWSTGIDVDGTVYGDNSGELQFSAGTNVTAEPDMFPAAVQPLAIRGELAEQWAQTDANDALVVPVDALFGTAVLKAPALARCPSFSGPSVVGGQLSVHINPLPVPDNAGVLLAGWTP